MFALDGDAVNWFKFHHDALNDPKVQRLDGDSFKAWVNLLCLASQQKERGTLPSVEDCAFALRMDGASMQMTVDWLVEVGLLEQHDQGTYTIHNWRGRQYEKPSDEPERVNERVRRHREKGCNAPVTPMKRDGNATDTEQIQSREEQNREEEIETADKPPIPIAEARTKKATAVPSEFAVTGDQYDWAKVELHLDSGTVDRETGKFLDHHRAKGSTMKDWGAAWKYWMRRSVEYRPAVRGEKAVETVQPFDPTRYQRIRATGGAR